MTTRSGIARGSGAAACAALATIVSACSAASPTPAPHRGVPLANAATPPATGELSSLTWTQTAANAPPLPRNSAGFVYDPATHNIVLSSGREGCGGSATTYTDTWTLAGHQWQLQPSGQSEVSPGYMASFTAAYDPGTSQVIALGIYSGCGVVTAQMTWNGTAWTAAPEGATLPHPMFSRGLVYDTAAHQLIAVGPAETQPLSGVMAMETWAYDGASWHQLNPATSPPLLEGMSVAYDTAANRVVLFGGAPPTNGSTAPPAGNQTWAFDGSTWTQLSTPVAPASRMDAAMVYDDALGKLVLFGGASSSPDVGKQPQVYDDMWTFDGTTWQQLHPHVMPSGRFDAQMTYDAAAQQIVLFGGALSTTTDSNDLWTFGAH